MIKGEVWLLNLEPTIGAEMQKTRPVVIVSNNSIGELPLKVVIPITEWKNHFATAIWKVRLEPDTNNGLNKPSAADAFQVRSVSQQRFIRRIGTLSDTDLEAINLALEAVFDM